MFALMDKRYHRGDVIDLVVRHLQTLHADSNAGAFRKPVFECLQ